MFFRVSFFSFFIHLGILLDHRLTTALEICVLDAAAVYEIKIYVSYDMLEHSIFISYLTLFRA